MLHLSEGQLTAGLLAPAQPLSDAECQLRGWLLNMCRQSVIARRAVSATAGAVLQNGPRPIQSPRSMPALQRPNRAIWIYTIIIKNEKALAGWRIQIGCVLTFY